MTLNQLLVIVGPTGVGKTDVADVLAARQDSVVVSADAMQVYQGMDIGTAKPSKLELKAPLLGINLAHIDEDYTVAHYQRDARNIIDDYLEEGVVPILCGGTGLYVQAVIDDMVFPPGSQRNNSIREMYEQISVEHGTHFLHDLLSSRDPESAALIHENNVRRVIRALELLDTGSSYAQHHEGLSRLKPFYHAHQFGLTMDRATLYQRIDERVLDMIEKGLLHEIKSLLDQGYLESLTASQAIGYKEFIDVLTGDKSLEHAIEEVQRSSRRYAKRQLSWFKRDDRIHWIQTDGKSSDEVVDEILHELDFAN